MKFHDKTLQKSSIYGTHGINSDLIIKCICFAVQTRKESEHKHERESCLFE